MVFQWFYWGQANIEVEKKTIDHFPRETHGILHHLSHFILGKSGELVDNYKKKMSFDEKLISWYA